jgi:hypothetical protein
VNAGLKVVGVVGAVFVSLFSAGTVLAHGKASTRTLHTRCLYAPARDSVGRSPCTVTLPANVRLGSTSVLLVEIGSHA